MAARYRRVAAERLRYTDAVVAAMRVDPERLRMRRHAEEVSDFGTVDGGAYDRDVLALRAPRIVWAGRSAAVALIAAATVACASLSPTLPSAEPLTLPGPMQELPDGAGEGASWVRADDRLPAGIGVGANYPDENAAWIAFTEPFGRRPMPPNSPGITSSSLEAAPGEMRILVTYPTFVDERTWGEQFVIVLREGSDGWRLDQAWARALCTTEIDHESCA
jgi:hypothetical protein